MGSLIRSVQDRGIDLTKIGTGIIEVTEIHLIHVKVNLGETKLQPAKPIYSLRLDEKRFNKLDYLRESRRS